MNEQKGFLNKERIKNLVVSLLRDKRGRRKQEIFRKKEGKNVHIEDRSKKRIEMSNVWSSLRKRKDR